MAMIEWMNYKNGYSVSKVCEIEESIPGNNEEQEESVDVIMAIRRELGCQGMFIVSFTPLLFSSTAILSR